MKAHLCKVSWKYRTGKLITADFPLLSLLISRLSFFLAILNTFFLVLSLLIILIVLPPHPAPPLAFTCWCVCRQLPYCLWAFILPSTTCPALSVASCTTGCWFTCLLNSTFVRLLQAQRILDQDNVSCVWHRCLWVWILTLLHPCTRDLSWCLLMYLSVLRLHHRAMTVISSTADLAVLQIYCLPSCEAINVLCEVFIFLCVALLVPRNLSPSGATHIPCLFCSLLRTYLVLFAFILHSF